MKKALFLDRDGIINVDHGYVHKISEFEFTEGIMDLCKQAITYGYDIFVITNQSGIARGYFTEEDFKRLTEWMIKEFHSNKVDIKKVYYCPHHDTKGLNEYKVKCLCRKPEPGLIIKAAQEYNIELSQSIFIGDKESDMLAAERAAIPFRILVASNYTNTNSVSAIKVNNIIEAKHAFISQQK